MTVGCAFRALPISSVAECSDCALVSCPDREILEIEYLGAGGYRLERGSDLVLIAPFFSNPSLLQASGLLRIAPDVAAIDRWLPDVSSAAAILVGHSHYDHLLDVPWIAVDRAPRSMVYGNDTASHILAAVPELRGRVVALNDAAYAPGRPEQWIDIPGTRVRFLAIASEHAAHFRGLNFMQGRLEADLEELPRRATEWLAGLTLTFLIEFLSSDGATAVFRIHYQDTASTPPAGFPPAGIGRVDAALTCVASHREVEGYPEELLRILKPRHVVLGHWEDFFEPYTQDPEVLQVVPFSYPRQFIRRVELAVPPGTGARWTLPAPGARIRLAGCPGRGAPSR